MESLFSYLNRTLTWRYWLKCWRVLQFRNCRPLHGNTLSFNFSMIKIQYAISKSKSITRKWIYQT